MSRDWLPPVTSLDSLLQLSNNRSALRLIQKPQINQIHISKGDVASVSGASRLLARRLDLGTHTLAGLGGLLVLYVRVLVAIHCIDHVLPITMVFSIVIVFNSSCYDHAEPAVVSCSAHISS